MKKQISIFGLALVSGLMSACGGGGGSIAKYQINHYSNL